MSERELAQLFGRATREIDALQRARIRELRGIERELFAKMVAKLTEALDAGGGKVTTRRGSASINELVDEVFRAMERGPLKTFYANSASDLFKILGNNDLYYAGLLPSVSKAGDKRYKQMRGEVDRVMRGVIGIDAKGKPVGGGYFDLLIKNTAAKTEVMQTINAGVNAGLPMGRLMEQVGVVMKGTQASPGALSKQLQNHILDTYQKFDRASNKAYATKLKLDTFIYQGGLIETSREFCVKRDGKVFTEKEAEKWRCDPLLPKKKAEGKCAGVYNPLVDMGRYNCRHRTRYISRALAEHLRPDLIKS